MVSKFQWKPFWLATQRDPQNDWTATQNRVNYDVFAQAPLVRHLDVMKPNITLINKIKIEKEKVPVVATKDGEGS